MTISGSWTAARTSSSMPSDGVRPPSANAAFSSSRSAPPAWAVSASSTEATATSSSTRGAGVGAIGRLVLRGILFLAQGAAGEQDGHDDADADEAEHGEDQQDDDLLQAEVEEREHV